jgi:hypothetical protein
MRPACAARRRSWSSSIAAASAQLQRQGLKMREITGASEHEPLPN